MPLQTGLKVIDALIPIGRGQRELILGDRQTGKTAIALDTILNQSAQNVVCIYCAIGQRASAVAKTVANLREKGALEHIVVVVTEGNDPPGLAYVAPYAASTSIRACWNGRPIWARTAGADRSPPCPSSRPKRRTFPPTFPPI